MNGVLEFELFSGRI